MGVRHFQRRKYRIHPTWRRRLVEAIVRARNVARGGHVLSDVGLDIVARGCDNSGRARAAHRQGSSAPSSHGVDWASDRGGYGKIRTPITIGRSVCLLYSAMDRMSGILILIYTVIRYSDAWIDVAPCSNNTKKWSQVVSSCREAVDGCMGYASRRWNI